MGRNFFTERRTERLHDRRGYENGKVARDETGAMDPGERIFIDSVGNLPMKMPKKLKITENHGISRNISMGKGSKFLGRQAIMGDPSRSLKLFLEVKGW